MSLDAATVSALRGVLGDAALSDANPVELDGRRIAWRLEPRGPEALAAALRALSERDLAVLVRGGGTRSALGNPLRRADLVLSTVGLAGIHEIDAEEGVARFGAGTPIARAAEALADTGWELPLEAVAADSSVGGALACGSPGLRFGAPREAVLGLDVVLASGARTRCGGRVVKNVTGYDLAKLQVGALGSLGVIEAAWLRLRPVPERLESWLLPAPDAAAALDWARRPSVRVALLDEHLLLELAGDAAAVAVDAEALGAAGAEPAARDAIDSAWLRGPREHELRFRIDFLPSRLAAVAAALGPAAHFQALPGRGLAQASFAGDDPDAAEARVRRAAAAGGGGWRLEAAPPHAKHGRDVFGELAAALPLMRALKLQFDPGGVLNPGRCAGAL